MAHVLSSWTQRDFTLMWYEWLYSLLSLQGDEAYEGKLFALTTLLASTLVYNTMQIINHQVYFPCNHSHTSHWKYLNRTLVPSLTATEHRGP